MTHVKHVKEAPHEINQILQSLHDYKNT